MQVRKTTVPKQSLLHKYMPANYIDAFSCEFKTEKQLTPDEIMISFWTVMPPWVEVLFKLRNILVKPFGLETGQDEKNEMLRECITKGTSKGMISLAGKSPEETVLLLSDKHLNAYVSVYLEEPDKDRKNVTVTTLVRFHYWLGYVYFYTICPFHHLVVRSVLKSTIKRLIS